MKIDPRKEWNQIYVDAFRIFRDYFYVGNLHGMDWDAVQKKYGELLPDVPSRFDLDYILNEIVSETNTGHAYVDWGDIATVDRINGGLLGAELEADLSAKRYKIKKIYAGENVRPSRQRLESVGVWSRSPGSGAVVWQGTLTLRRRVS